MVLYVNSTEERTAMKRKVGLPFVDLQGVKKLSLSVYRNHDDAASSYQLAQLRNAQETDEYIAR